MSAIAWLSLMLAALFTVMWLGVSIWAWLSERRSEPNTHPGVLWYLVGRNGHFKR
jgi:hypothetical protein